MWQDADGKHIVSGCLHMHTRYSDGSGTTAEIARAAAEAELDYVIITDHMNLDALPEAGRYENVQVLVGYEHNDRDSRNHYLALGVNKVADPNLAPEQIPTAIRKAGGVGIICHPEERRAHMRELPPYPWTAWSNSDFDGIELWNQMSEWTEHLTRWNRYARVWSPRKSLVGPSDRILYVWDILNTRRPIAGLAGVDAHAWPYPLGPFTISIYPYKVHFRTLQTHMILDTQPPGNPAGFRAALLDAIRGCRLYFSNERWGATRGFRMHVESNGMSAGIGQTADLGGGPRLHARWPGEARYEVVYNGFPMWKGTGSELSHKLTLPGVYRVALYRRNRIWLITNHIRIVDG